MVYQVVTYMTTHGKYGGKEIKNISCNMITLCIIDFLVKDCKAEMKNIRDQYVRTTKKKPASGSAYSTKNAHHLWLLANCTFLDAHIVRRTGKSNLSAVPNPTKKNTGQKTLGIKHKKV